MDVHPLARASRMMTDSRHPKPEPPNSSLARIAAKPRDAAARKASRGKMCYRKSKQIFSIVYLNHPNTQHTMLLHYYINRLSDRIELLYKFLTLLYIYIYSFFSKNKCNHNTYMVKLTS